MKTIAVLGTGNVAQTIAVDMKAKGQEVRLFAPDYLFSRFQTIAAETGVDLFRLVVEVSKIDQKAPSEELIRSVATKLK